MPPGREGALSVRQKALEEKAVKQTKQKPDLTPREQPGFWGAVLRPGVQAGVIQKQRHRWEPGASPNPGGTELRDGVPGAHVPSRHFL